MDLDNAKNTVSKQAVIENVCMMLRNCFNASDEMIESVKITVGELPPAQPEPLTDKEQRIFLAAMEREEKVCKQVDDECRNCREPYEDSLVRTCHEITRKVKGALWET